MDMMTLAAANNYTDSQRLAYAEISKKVFLPETTYDTGSDEYIGIAPIVGLEVGKIYTVIFDGIEYANEYKEFNGEFWLGNGVLANVGGNPADTGEPFGYYSDGEIHELCVAEAGTHTMKIVGVGEVVHTIDPKFLPSPFPFVDLTGFYEGSQATVISDPSILSKLKDIYESKSGGVLAAVDCDPMLESATLLFSRCELRNGAVMYATKPPVGTSEIFAIQLTMSGTIFGATLFVGAAT